jgi:GNAT superfamily N-acetyltransferase
MSARDDRAVLRDFEPRDLEAVLALRARVFPAARDLERERRRWSWEFDANPFRSDAAPCTWVAEEEGTLVGNYGLVPAPVSIDGETTLGLAGIDIAVAPERQGSGLGGRMVARHMSLAGAARREGDSAAFPFITSPAPAIVRLVEREGGTVVRAGEEPCLWVFHATNATPTPRPPPGVHLRPVDHFDPRFDELQARMAERHRLLVARSRRYLDWRYGDYPFGRPAIVAALEDVRASARLRGFLVLQHDPGRNVGYLLELFAPEDDEAALLALIATAVELARAKRVADLYALNRVAAVQELLRQSGFERVAGDEQLAFACRLPPAAPGRSPLAASDLYWSPGDGDLLFGVGGADGIGGTGGATA